MFTLRFITAWIKSTSSWIIEFFLKGPVYIPCCYTGAFLVLFNFAPSAYSHFWSGYNLQIRIVNVKEFFALSRRHLDTSRPVIEYGMMAVLRRGGTTRCPSGSIKTSRPLGKPTSPWSEVETAGGSRVYRGTAVSYCIRQPILQALNPRTIASFKALLELHLDYSWDSPRLSLHPERQNLSFVLNILFGMFANRMRQ